MSIIKKLILFIKSMFNRKLEVKELPETRKCYKDEFVKDLKVNTTRKSENGRIYTLISKGDGLGIQKKMNY